MKTILKPKRSGSLSASKKFAKPRKAEKSSVARKSKKARKKMEKIQELYGHDRRSTVDWDAVSESQKCPFIGRKCLKTRKSEPDITIGTCTVAHKSTPVIICPKRLLEKRQIFSDCLQLLTKHEPGNEFHLIPEMGIPGGNIDYVLASVLEGKVMDFVGIELQTLDTTGTFWPERQKFLLSKGVAGIKAAAAKPAGMNWKMTCKTILIQLHHKIEFFELANSHLVLVVQDCLLDHLRKEFQFSHVGSPKSGHSMHFHAYSLTDKDEGLNLKLKERVSTDAAGIALCLGQSVDKSVSLEEFVSNLEARISPKTLVTIA